MSLAATAIGHFTYVTPASAVAYNLISKAQEKGQLLLHKKVESWNYICWQTCLKVVGEGCEMNEESNGSTLSFQLRDWFFSPVHN
jgi:hypothetical protein